MIDTVELNFSPIFIDKGFYSDWNDSERHKKPRYTILWHGFTFYLPNNASIQYTYYPYLENGLLKIQLSLPNIVFGNNVQMIYNVEEAIDVANTQLPDIPGIPKLDLWSGILYRLDVSYNFQIGDLLPWYVKSLLALEYPYRRTRPYTTQGVQYENERAILRFYDKARERKDEGDLQGAVTASGILRMEAELKKIYIRKLISGNKQPTLRDIDLPWLLGVVENELKKLKLFNRSIGTVDTTFRVLREKYGYWEARALIGLMQTKMSYPSMELLAQDADLHANSIGRHIKKKFVENGLPPTLTEHTEPLPPLVIDRDFVLSQSVKGINCASSI